MTERRLDEKDRALIGLLEANARMPVAVLARKLGLARTTVQERIHRLESSGVIAGYGLRLAPRSDGAIDAQVSLSVDPKRTESVIRALKDFPEIKSCLAVSGAFDLVVAVRAPDMGAIDQVLDRIGALSGVERTHSAIVLATKFRR